VASLKIGGKSGENPALSRNGKTASGSARMPTYEFWIAPFA
jgi:hypothetical protein